MKKYENLVKVTFGLALVLALGIASFNQPSLAVASSTSYDVDAVGTADAVVFTVADQSYMIGPYTSAYVIGYEQPILLPQVNDKLFDH